MNPFINLGHRPAISHLVFNFFPSSNNPVLLCSRFAVSFPTLCLQLINSSAARMISSDPYLYSASGETNFRLFESQLNRKFSHLHEFLISSNLLHFALGTHPMKMTRFLRTFSLHLIHLDTITQFQTSFLLTILQVSGNWLFIMLDFTFLAMTTSLVLFR